MNSILMKKESWGGIHFHMNGFVRRPVLTQRQNSARKWSSIIAGLLAINAHVQILFDSNIKQWVRHCFLWAILEFNSSFFYSKTNHKDRGKWVHGLRHHKTKPYIDPFQKWLPIINSFVIIKISLTSLVFELIIQKNFYSQTSLVRLI